MKRFVPMFAIGLVMVGTTVPQIAHAFSEGSDSDAVPETAPVEDSSGHQSSDYTYSGHTFNFSMSKDEAQSGAGDADQSGAATKSEAQSKHRPGLVRRIFRSVFGGN